MIHEYCLVDVSCQASRVLKQKEIIPTRKRRREKLQFSDGKKRMSPSFLPRSKVGAVIILSKKCYLNKLVHINKFGYEYLGIE